MDTTNGKEPTEMTQTHTIGKHATTVKHFDNGNVAVNYQATRVVLANGNTGTVRLDSGGWKTQTTKTRMNQFANQYGMKFHVYQLRGEWYVETPSGTIEFTDGMEFSTTKARYHN